MLRILSKNRRAFTLIELLIVILILAILMAVALPLYLAAVTDSQVKSCRANMQTIANAEQAYKTSSAGHSYTTDLSNLSDNIGIIHGSCPSGGTYTVTVSNGSDTGNNGKPVPAGGVIVHCTVGVHGVFAPGVDSE